MCNRCNQLKPLDHFAFKNKALGKYGAYCKPCNHAYQKQHYELNREDYLQKRVAYHTEIDRKNRVKMLEYLHLHPCIDCGEADVRVLEFDHLHSKKANIAQMFADSYRWEKILKEIEKCEVRCANCHKR
jgi:hypothetical protein